MGRDPFNDGLVPLLRLLSTGLSILIALAATGVTLVGFGAYRGWHLAGGQGMVNAVGFGASWLRAAGGRARGRE